ncbi:MAG TPA: hypothetical protein VH762_02735 [Gemmatimonadaceae bacterium]
MTRSCVGLLCLTIAACDESAQIVQPSPNKQVNSAAAPDWLRRYVAIGTSVSMGWMSDGVVAQTQEVAWPVQLTRIAQTNFIIPRIATPGCKAPLAAPVITFKRMSGEPANVSDATAICAPNEPGIVFPTQNLALPSALTSDALNTTPELQAGPLLSRLYSRVLPPGETQVTAMEKLHPTFVSVELGANDILGIHSGVVIPGVSFVPFAVWSAQFSQVLDRVGATTQRALVVGLGRDIAKLSSLRRGDELWADRAAFLASFHVSVSGDCNDNRNLLVVPVLVPTAVATGLGRKAAGLSPYVLSCAAGSSTTQDRILTTAEAATVNRQLALMNDHARAQANSRGYAFFDLEILYGRPKPRFSAVSLMTSAAPYGTYISLDGLHPSAAGHAILAEGALRAINDRYRITLAMTDGAFLSRAAR